MCAVNLDTASYLEGSGKAYLKPHSCPCLSPNQREMTRLTARPDNCLPQLPCPMFTLETAPPQSCSCLEELNLFLAPADTINPASLFIRNNPSSSLISVLDVLSFQQF